jgi:uncharacterized membrane protein affecting hemolysin expression
LQLLQIKLFDTFLFHCHVQDQEQRNIKHSDHPLTSIAPTITIIFMGRRVMAETLIQFPVPKKMVSENNFLLVACIKTSNNEKHLHQI